MTEREREGERDRETEKQRDTDTERQRVRERHIKKERAHLPWICIICPLIGTGQLFCIDTGVLKIFVILDHPNFLSS